MPKLSDDFKNEVLSHAAELVRRYKEILKQIEQDRKKGRTIRPTDRQINKFWPLEMLLAKYGAIFSHRQRKEKMQQEWRSWRKPLPSLHPIPDMGEIS